MTILGQKTGHCIVRFGQKILTGHLPKKPDCPVKNRTPGNPSTNATVYSTAKLAGQKENVEMRRLANFSELNLHTTYTPLQMP